MNPWCRSCSKLKSENFDGDDANDGDGGDDGDENVDDDDDGRLLLWQVMSPTHTPSLALRLLHYHLSCIAATSIYCYCDSTTIPSISYKCLLYCH